MKIAHLPAHATDLLEFHYTNGNLDAAVDLQESLSAIYIEDKVNFTIADLYFFAEKHFHEDHARFGACMINIVKSLSEITRDTLWANMIIESALNNAEIPDLIDAALTYIDIAADRNSAAYFLKILETVCNVSTCEHWRYTYNYVNELVELNDMIHDIDPEWVDKFKELILKVEIDDDSIDEDVCDDLTDLVEMVEDLTNGATANQIIINLINDCIHNHNDELLKAILCYGFDDIIYFNDDIISAPLTALEYINNRQNADTHYVSDTDLTDAAFSAINALRYYVKESHSTRQYRFYNKWYTVLCGMEDSRIDIVDTNKYHIMIMNLKNDIEQMPNKTLQNACISILASKFKAEINSEDCIIEPLLAEIEEDDDLPTDTINQVVNRVVTDCIDDSDDVTLCNILQNFLDMGGYIDYSIVDAPIKAIDYALNRNIYAPAPGRKANDRRLPKNRIIQLAFDAICDITDCCTHRELAPKNPVKVCRIYAQYLDRVKDRIIGII